MKNETPAVLTIENPHAPEFFVVGALGSFCHHGNIHLTLASPRGMHSDQGAQMAHVASVRIILSMSNAEAFANFLLEQVNRQLEQQIPLPSGGQKH